MLLIFKTLMFLDLYLNWFDLVCFRTFTARNMVSLALTSLVKVPVNFTKVALCSI